MRPGEPIEFPIEEEYKKSHGVTAEDVTLLRRWLQTQPHLPEQYITDLDLVLAYHSCNRSTEVTKQLIDLNYTLRTSITDYFQARNDDGDLQRILNNFLILPLPARSNDGNAILYSQLINTDVTAFSCTDLVKGLLLILDVWQYEEGTWPGLELVVNFSNYSLGHIARIDIRNIQLFACYFQEAIPLQLKRIHLISAPSYIDKLLALAKPFLSNQLRDNLHVYKDGVTALEKFMPAHIFPKDVGGDYETVNECKDDVLKKLQASASFFAAESKKRVSEELRPVEQRRGREHEHLAYGSFKKLDID
ncbi:alpha-tocopherol transfer protein-like [Leptidea sinapis]|uniref:alpha-tocopherol transfer protein-like n=1 Tax=Leptidea sinapis TaxID=189913 RepID=UPI002139B533|nr:alpha-tocopherol transfer protein-like [Leptidea sinapis]XP_050672616.1 alpha-tocopherol transfer protein-like [Leptidea sinapis]XP_050672701.1 alpha-tocopherol transfer protein-like [Leptidea sinapis]XP_050672772.1 alpha-tocopherol transfer protein-like [Leptidea sinapis]XP_050672829.1 alpha-tocopherol transfer protein-like [Leptidea sinapis]XP_050672916.1 alpha-tocopherol transfer protein-like [Leptidea sinapis]XP_050672992.1 alpha-tocopherol transfer protein-like [Leptidea sinapis]XP_0